VRLQVCDKTCVWVEQRFAVPVAVQDGPPAPLTAAVQERLRAGPPAIKVVPVPPEFGGPATASAAGGSRNAAPSGLLGFMLTGIFWGAVSLVTPCVFPMIPITVSFF